DRERSARVVVVEAAIAGDPGESCGLPRIHVRDVSACRQPLSVACRHAGHAPAARLDAIDLVLEEERRPGPPEDAGELADEMAVVILRVVRAAVVERHERSVEKERDIARREEVVAALTGEYRLELWRHPEMVVEILERPAEVVEDVPRAHGP